MKRLLFLGAALFAAAVASPAQASAEPVYTVTVVAGAGSVASDLNNLGQVVGRLDSGGGTYHGFLYDGSTLADLGTLAGGSSTATGINDSGVVVGNSWTDFSYQAFTYAGGALTPLALPGNNVAEGINNAGVIVGTAQFLDGDGFYAPRAVIYDHGVVTNLGLLPGNGEGSSAIAINSAGKVVGTGDVEGPPNRPADPFLYADGVMQNLGNFGGIYGVAWSINDHDQIVGSTGAEYIPGSGNLYPYRAFLYDASGLHDLGTLIEDGNSSAFDINNLGQIVGSAQTSGGFLATLYVDGAVKLLNSLIDPASGWSIVESTAINDLGQIAGTGCKDGLCYAVRLDLASAIPEPAHALMLLAGMGLVAGLRRSIGRRVDQPCREALAAAFRT